ncbi:MAG TPA: gamma-glutamylcyclotransferase, partial [Caldimonas sp.]
MVAKAEHVKVDTGTTAGEARHAVTRDRLRDGSFLAALRAAAPAGAVFRSDAELSSSLAETLVGRDPAEDVWVFGYGSLMWNPALNYVESCRADLRGWCRRFCIRTYAGRGAPETPGLMLALDRGGTCRGIAFRIATADVEE